MISKFIKKSSCLICCSLMGMSVSIASDANWTLLKMDGNYASVNESLGAYITVARVRYEDPTREIVHMAKFNSCDEPLFADENKTFTVKNCVVGKDLRQNIYGKLSNLQDLDDKNGKYYNQTYLVAKNPSDDKYSSAVSEFMNNNYLENPYKGWISNRISTDPTTWFEENYELKATILVRKSKFDDNVTTDEALKVLAQSLLCDKKTKKSDTEYLLEKCKTYSVFTLKLIGDKEYLIVGVNNEAKDKTEVENKISEIIQQVKAR